MGQPICSDQLRFEDDRAVLRALITCAIASTLAIEAR